MENIDLKADISQPVNVAHYLKRMARQIPYKRAVVYPVGEDKGGRITYAHLTFQQLDRESDRLAHGFNQIGIRRGVRTILMMRPGLEFFAVAYALFKTGAIPVIVDPGMGRQRMVNCLEESRPTAFIGIPLAHMLRALHFKQFKTVKIWVTTGNIGYMGVYKLDDLRMVSDKPFPIAETTESDTAAILFTTGSTGPAKGVVYSHGMFDAQVRHIQSHFNITTEDIDLPTFPLFALFDPALGMTSIIPDMDPTRPAEANPEKIIEAIINHGVNTMFASPALLNRLGQFGQKTKIKLPSLKRVISAGAPVYPSNIDTFLHILPEDGEIHTPYGATESMPTLSISSTEILSETRPFTEKGYGICVGRPVGDIEAVIIRITDDPIENWTDELVVHDGDIGEITVKGQVVSRQYFQRPKHDALSKIRDGEKLWHRMGDLGWKDKHGRIWFCGRKSHRVITKGGTLFTIPCETVFNQHPAVFRSALVGIGPPNEQTPVICIELKTEYKSSDKETIEKELLELGAENVQTKDIEFILFHDKFEVDIRHNAKIFREKLAKWAEQKLA